MEIESQKMVLAPAISYAGSAIRLWRALVCPLRVKMAAWPTWARLLGLACLYPFAWTLVGLTWVGVTAYYLLMYVVFGVLFIPWRILRRGARKRRLDDTRHAEMLAAISRDKDSHAGA